MNFELFQISLTIKKSNSVQTMYNNPHEDKFFNSKVTISKSKNKSPIGMIMLFFYYKGWLCLVVLGLYKTRRLGCSPRTQPDPMKFGHGANWLGTITIRTGQTRPSGRTWPGHRFQDRQGGSTRKYIFYE